MRTEVRLEKESIPMYAKLTKGVMPAMLMCAMLMATGCCIFPGGPDCGGCVDCAAATAPRWEPPPAAPAAPPPPPPAPVVAAAPVTKPGLVCDSITVTKNVHSVKGSAQVKLDKCAPKTVIAGDTFAYQMTITNTGTLPVQDVMVTDKLPDGFKLASSNPPAGGSISGKTIWELGSMAPGQSASITVNGVAGETGQLVNCATVSFLREICVTTAVVKPALAITKTAPAQVMLCDPIPVKIVVTNTGTGPATNVVVNDNLPAGLMTVDNQSSLRVNVGTLAAGQSKTINTTLKAQKRGTYKNVAVASADRNLSADASTTTEVREPVLTIDKKGPTKAWLGTNIKYSIVVTNKGNAPAANTVVTDALPAGGKFVSASSGGQFSGGNVVWNLGTLAPGASRSLEVTVNGATIASFVNRASVKATCAPQVAATVTTKVDGIPAILLEVIDVEDPIEIGATTTYVITATNQGSLAGKNVTITCTLESSQQYVSSSGSTRGSVSGRTVNFAPLPSLAPKASAEWKVVIKATKVGDVRFSVQMDEDRLTRPVNETEATNQYE